MASLTDRQIEVLAGRLERCATSRALALMIATRAVVESLSSGESPQAVEADLRRELGRYEELQVRQKIDEKRRSKHGGHSEKARG